MFWKAHASHPCKCLLGTASTAFPLQRLFLLPRYLEIRWSNCCLRTTAANQGEGENTYKCASGCAENPALLLSSSSSGASLLQHWFNPVLISLDSLSWHHALSIIWSCTWKIRTLCTGYKQQGWSGNSQSWKSKSIFCGYIEKAL